MDENKLRFGVGVLVLSAIGIGVVLTFLFGAFPSVLQSEYTLNVVFPSAEGIGVSTPVVRDGVRIGRVSTIELRDEGGVLVTLSMDSSRPMTHRYVPQIGTGNFVTGDAQLEFVRASQATIDRIFVSDQSMITAPYGDGEFLDYGTKARSLFEMQSDLETTFEAIRNAGTTIATAADSVNQLAAGIQQTVGGSDSKFDQMSDKALLAMQEFQATMQEIRSIIGNPQLKANLQSTFETLPIVLDDVHETLGSAQQTFDRFEKVGVQFELVGEAAVATVDTAQQAVQNIEQITSPFAENSDVMMQQVLQTMRQLDASMGQVTQFMSALNNQNSTVRRFLEDEDLYWEIRRTVENIEQASARMRPILDDVRIFTDKIARDPRQLGVKGALNNRPSGLGLK
ncbi:MAG: MlaD family protein [Planctomycetota bacterium]|nr:MlaD family protein [Planctomycetota bacterium]MEC7679730.1 MlaD family protein [Planctomycetota bacterium]